MSKILDCRAVALEKKALFRKDFFGNFEILEHPLYSKHSQSASVVQSGRLQTIFVQRVRQAVDYIRAPLIKGNSPTYFFLTIFHSFRSRYFETPSSNHLRWSLGEFWTVRPQSCFVLKNDSTRDNSLKVLEVKLSPLQNL